MGRKVVERLSLRGDETVLDAGCGTGRVTEVLLERLPRGRVIAVDADPAMVAKARDALAGHGTRVEVRQADLLRLDLTEAVDAVLSTATFHWVLDHDRLFAQLFSALRPAGALVAQCGGAGNLDGVLGAAADVSVEGPWADRFAGWSRPSRMETAEATAARLRAAGFVDVRCWLDAEPVQPDDPRAYLATINLGPHLQRLAADDQRDDFLDRVLERLGDPVTIDYVRLNLDARRPA